MDPRFLPPRDFSSTRLVLTTEAPGSVWQRIYESRHPSPLGFGRALSRFSGPTGKESGLVYLGSSAKVAFAEVILRDRAVGALNPFPITMAELESYTCADIEITQPLNMIDLTGDGHLRLRVPTDVTRAQDQTLARIWSEAFHGHPDQPDGVLYASRLNDERNIALYDRAAVKLRARSEE